MQNPFTLSFGKEPLQFISRITESEEVIQTFTSEIPSNQVFMITGVRGSGKTVMLTEIAKVLRQDDAWIVISLNPTRDLLQSLAAKLYSIPELYRLFIKAKFDFSMFGLGLSIENVPPVADIESVLELMFKKIKEHKKKVLITVDEVIANEYIKVFVSSFQVFLREEYPVFLIMTGLYENIYDLQNDKSLTFLYRAPKIALKPLSMGAIKNKYLSVFDFSEESAVYMAKLTKGYPFAFQVLGYLYWKYRREKSIDEILPEYDQYLEEYVYLKIWSELSEQDKVIVAQLSCDEYVRVKDVRQELGISSGLFSVYRNRLIQKGLVDTSRYGCLAVRPERALYIVGWKRPPGKLQATVPEASFA